MASNLVYGFLDESPNLSSTSYFFCVSVLVGENPANKSLFNIIKKAREKLSVKEKKVSELKFANTLPKIRKLILELVAKQEIEIFAFVVETAKQKVADIPQNYGLVVGKTISLVCEEHKYLSITLDRKYIKPEDVAIMEKTINETVMFDQKPKFLALREGNSKEDPLLQLTDFIVGAISSKYNANNPTFWKIIEKKVKKEKVIGWKELKRSSQPLRILTTAS